MYRVSQKRYFLNCWTCLAPIMHIVLIYIGWCCPILALIYFSQNAHCFNCNGLHNDCSVLGSPSLGPVDPQKLNFWPPKKQFWSRIGSKFDLVQFLDLGVLITSGQRIWTTFRMIFSGIPHSAIFWAINQIPKYGQIKPNNPKNGHLGVLGDFRDPPGPFLVGPKGSTLELLTPWGAKLKKAHRRLKGATFFPGAFLKGALLTQNV